jgi:hypothetical protein
LHGRVGDLVAGWARSGWPAMVRRPAPGDAPDAIPAGLPLPPEHGELRLVAGGVGQPGWLDAAVAVHRSFVQRRLSPGGCADLLTATRFIDRMETGI